MKTTLKRELRLIDTRFNRKRKVLKEKEEHIAHRNRKEKSLEQQRYYNNFCMLNGYSCNRVLRQKYLIEMRMSLE